jgi:SAM-dependent methyltransferase
MRNRLLNAEGKTMNSEKPWCENDKFWKAMQPFFFGEEIWQKAAGEIDQILNFLNLDPDSKILDLCCGPGRHSLELARRGLGVTGVDRTVLYLDQAKAKAKEEKLKIEFVQEDMRHFNRPNAFDAAISMFTSFGYFDDPAVERQVIDNIYQSLNPGGRLIMDMVSKEIVARIYQSHDWTEKGGIFRLEERKPTENWTYLENRMVLIRDGQSEEYHFKLRLYSAHELTTLLTATGFTQVDIYGDMEGAPYDSKAKRLIAIALK